MKNIPILKLIKKNKNTMEMWLFIFLINWCKSSLKLNLKKMKEDWKLVLLKKYCEGIAKNIIELFKVLLINWRKNKNLLLFQNLK